MKKIIKAIKNIFRIKKKNKKARKNDDMLDLELL